MRHSIVRAYQAAEHELVDLLADVDAEDALVYMPHRDDDMATLGRRMHEVMAQEDSLTGWEN